MHTTTGIIYLKGEAYKLNDRMCGGLLPVLACTSDPAVSLPDKQLLNTSSDLGRREVTFDGSLQSARRTCSKTHPEKCIRSH